MKRGLLLIDRGSRQREASEELEVICEGIKAKGARELRLKEIIISLIFVF